MATGRSPGMAPESFKYSKYIMLWACNTIGTNFAPLAVCRRGEKERCGVGRDRPRHPYRPATTQPNVIPTGVTIERHADGARYRLPGGTGRCLAAAFDLGVSDQVGELDAAGLDQPGTGVLNQ